MGKEGEPIDYTNLMTPEQQQIMAGMGQYLGEHLGETATPYSGTLSAQYDPAQLAAMNVMMQLGGQGGYNAPNIPVGAQAQYSDMGAGSSGVMTNVLIDTLPKTPTTTVEGARVVTNPDVEPTTRASAVVLPNTLALPQYDVGVKPFDDMGVGARTGASTDYTYGRVVPHYIPSR